MIRSDQGFFAVAALQSSSRPPPFSFLVVHPLIRHQHHRTNHLDSHPVRIEHQKPRHALWIHEAGITRAEPKKGARPRPTLLSIDWSRYPCIARSLSIVEERYRDRQQPRRSYSTQAPNGRKAAALPLRDKPAKPSSHDQRRTSIAGFHRHQHSSQHRAVAATATAATERAHPRIRHPHPFRTCQTWRHLARK